MRQLIIFCTLLLSVVAIAQHAPRVSGLNADVRSSAAKARTTAVIPDTLKLPFFDDFTGYDRKFDSIVIKNAQPVRLYSPLLDSLGTGGTIILSFPDTITNSLKTKYPIFGTAHLSKEASGIYQMDTASTGFITALQFASDTVMYDAFWMQKGRYYQELDPYLWETSNVYLNNRFCKEPPSFNVVTFDGLKADGTPYNSSNTASIGPTDHLSSHVIDLSEYKISDSLYLSFYYQSTGFGETPDAGDYLQVQFLDTAGIWIDIWAKMDTGTVHVDTFAVANIPIIDSAAFFHDGFKFRFRSYGRQAGVYDVWNVDYIYLDKNRSYLYKSGQDWAIGEMDPTFLNNYTAIPYRHFEPVKASQSDSISFTIMNLRSYNQAAIDVYGSASDNTGTILNNNTFIQQYITDGSYLRRNSFEPNVAPLTAPVNAPRMIYQSVKIVAKDSALTFIHNNNVGATATNLINYYSYDDNTAEAGIGFELIGARMGNQYLFLQADTMTHVEFKFVRGRGKNMEGRSIIMKVWDEDFNELISQPIRVTYGYATYGLSTPVVVAPNVPYYVGYQQNFVDLLTVGFDKNTKRADKIYFKDGNNFVQYSTLADADSGAMMIRPVFVKAGDVFVGTKDPVEEKIISMYPMPVSGILNIEGRLSEVRIYNVLGEEVFSTSLKLSETSHELDLSRLPAGLYILRTGTNSVQIVKY